MTMIYHPTKDKRVKAKGFESKINPTFDKHGESFNQEYVEFTVVGKQSEYQDFMLLKGCQEHNPKIKVK